MTLASDNAFPKIIVTEGTTPASPSAGTQKLFIDSADHKLKRVNSAGSVTTVETASSGTSLNPGTSFPGTPSTDDLCFRTDRGKLYYYDGTRWLTLQQHRMQVTHLISAATIQDMIISATRSAWIRTFSPYLDSDSDVWLENWIANFVVAGGTALGGSHNWALVLKSARDATNATLDTIATLNINSGSSDSVRRVATSIGALLNNGTVHDWLQIDATKTGTPGTLQVYSELTYRLVG